MGLAALKELSEACLPYLPHVSGVEPDCFRVVADEAGRRELWFLRKNVVKILNDYGRKYNLIAPPVIEDLGVPLSKLGSLMYYLEEEFKKRKLHAGIYGHAGDGNLHVRPLFARTPEAMAEAWQLMDEVYRRVIGMGGTISAEHGDGLLRTPYLDEQYGASVTNLFRQIKELFDPRYILNPGVKVPHAGLESGKHEQWDIMGYLPTGGGKPFRHDHADLVH